MRESLQRIAAWARAHPWLAALIVGAVILLGYLVYKRSGSGGSGETNLALPEGTEQASPIPSMGDIPTSVSTGGSGSIPSSDVGVSTTTGSNTTPSVSLPQIPSNVPIDFGGASAGWSPSLDGAITNTIAPTLAKKSTGVIVGEKKKQPGRSSDKTPAQLVGKGRYFTGIYKGVTYIRGYPASSGVTLLSKTPTASGGIAVGEKKKQPGR